MNLAIDYMLRSGELLRSATFPVSLFVTRAESEVKTVITISESLGGKKVFVKHWLIGQCGMDDPVPPFQEHEIDRASICSSDKVILPKHDLLQYRPGLFKAGRKQHNDEPRASADEQEYRESFDFLFNSRKHRKVRGMWLWNAFVKNYNLYDTKHPYITPEGFSLVLKKTAPHLCDNWKMWKKYMLDHAEAPGEVAGELLFSREYERQAAAEGRTTPAEPRWKRMEITGTIFNSLSNWGSYTYQPADKIAYGSWGTAATSGTSYISWNNY